MESQFKKNDWIWIEGLQGAKDLNGKLGQIVKFNKEKHRYEVFIPDLDCHKFNKEFLSKAILPDKQADAQIKKLFPWREGRVANRMSWEAYKVMDVICKNHPYCHLWSTSRKPKLLKVFFRW